jgi:hypothetical protein
MRTARNRLPNLPHLFEEVPVLITGSNALLSLIPRVTHSLLWTLLLFS